MFNWCVKNSTVWADLIPNIPDGRIATEEAAALPAGVCLPLWAHLFKSSNLVITPTSHICGLTRFSPPDPPAYRMAMISTSPSAYLFFLHTIKNLSLFSNLCIRSSEPLLRCWSSAECHSHQQIIAWLGWLFYFCPKWCQVFSNQRSNPLEERFSVHKLSFRGDFMWYV